MNFYGVRISPDRSAETDKVLRLKFNKSHTNALRVCPTLDPA